MNDLCNYANGIICFYVSLSRFEESHWSHQPKICKIMILTFTKIIVWTIFINIVKAYIVKNVNQPIDISNYNFVKKKISINELILKHETFTFTILSSFFYRYFYIT